MWRKWNTGRLLVRISNGLPTVKNNWTICQKVLNRIIICFSNFTMNVYPKLLKAGTSADTFTSIYIATSFTVQNVETDPDIF